MSTATILSRPAPTAPAWPADAAIWPLLDDHERAVLAAARCEQGGYPWRPVSCQAIATRAGLGYRGVRETIGDLDARGLWPVPRCGHGGDRGHWSETRVSNLELAARIQMASRRKTAADDAGLRQREVLRLRAIRARRAVVRERREASGRTAS